MRFSLFLLAAATGLAVAQNVTTGPSEDIGQCIVACGEKAIQDNPGDANKCSGISDQTKQTQCICRSDALVTELGTCMTSTCPTLLAGIDVGQRLHQTCAELNAAPSLRAGGLRPVVAAASVLLVAGTFLF